MATRSVKPKRDEGMLTDWRSVPEKPPSSIVNEEVPTAVRVIAFVAFMLTAMGALSMWVGPWRARIGAGWGFFLFTLGSGGLLYHAFRDSDEQFRRVYGSLGFLLMGSSVLFRLLPYDDVIGGLFLTYGIPCLAGGLLVHLAVLRNETDEAWRKAIISTIAAFGTVLTLAGFLVSMAGGTAAESWGRSPDQILGEGVSMVVLGLMYLSSYVAMQGASSDTGFRVGLTMGGVGTLVCVITLIRCSLFGGQFIPYGIFPAFFGLVFVFTAAMICFDWPLIVLIRRELLAYFYSPIAYLVLFGSTIIGFVLFTDFLGFLSDSGNPVFQRGPPGVQEPIVVHYVMKFVSAAALLFIVPIITMRLLSEERRSGTLEVLLTAPVNETTIVLSKFFASVIFFMIALMPWWMNLVALRVIGGAPFEFPPLLCFLLALFVSGAGLMSIGLFFSAITQNQIVAAVLTFAAMLALVSIYFATLRTQGGWRDLSEHISFLNLWLTSLQGKLVPRALLFHASIAIFFVFLSVKALDTRKWA